MSKVYSRFALPPSKKGVICKTPALNPVQPQFKGICDINNIVKRAFAGDATVFRAARCGDISHAPDNLHSALQQQVEARNAYDSLPASVKQAYPTPEAFFEACHSEKDLEKLRNLGVVKPEEIETPVEVKIVNEPVTSEEA